MAPLRVLLGTDPRNPLSADLPDLPDNPTDQAARAHQLVAEAKKAQDIATANSLKAQQRQEVQANKSRRPVDFGVNDYVFLRKRGFATTKPTTRLDSQWAGPFKIVEEKGYSYVLDVPNFKGKNLFHADRLRKASNDPLPQQIVEPPPPEDMNGEPEYEVERILSSRINRGKLQYKIGWKGCDPDDEWYPARNLRNAPAALRRYHDEYPSNAGPPVRLPDWLLAAAEDRFLEEHKDNDKPLKISEKHRTRRHL